MYGNATLATLVSRTSINAAIDTVAAIAHGFTLGRQTTCSDGRVSAVALIAGTLSLRHSYQAEDGSRCSGNAVHMTVIRAAVRVQLNLGPLACVHVFELGFFEISGNPHL